jgi:hypothetical protein
VFEPMSIAPQSMDPEFSQGIRTKRCRGLRRGALCVQRRADQGETTVEGADGELRQRSSATISELSAK